MTIKVKIHHIDADGIGRRYETVTRNARDYRHAGDKETAWIRVHGRVIRAEKYPHTVWTAELRTDLLPITGLTPAEWQQQTTESAKAIDAIYERHKPAK
jgi:hypothetical protein